MKAVFRSSQPYLQVMKAAVMAEKPVCSEPSVIYLENVGKVIVKGEMVGTEHVAPLTSENESYIFMEGKKHNLLTLTTPEEIEAMRKFAESREIVEISFEPDILDVECFLSQTRLRRNKNE